MRHLEAKLEQNGNGSNLLRLSGAIDESAALEKILNGVEDATIINLRDVERINSIGVHGWIKSFVPLTKKHQIIVEELSYPFVMQAMIVYNLFGTAKVKSCMAPYFCASCGDNPVLAVSAEEVSAAGGGIPPKSCAKCSKALEFDELEDYFGFFSAY